MRTVPVVQLKANLSALLAEVARGEEIAITRHGQVVARLVPGSPAWPQTLSGRFGVTATSIPKLLPTACLNLLQRSTERSVTCWIPIS